MIELKTGTRIWIAAGLTDLRRGFRGLSSLVETVLEQQPYSGHVFVLRLLRLQLFELQFQLIDLAADLLALRAEEHAPQLGDKMVYGRAIIGIVMKSIQALSGSG